MLILTRHRDEVIRIGPSVSVMVVSIVGDTVRLGISAPKDTLVLRGELLEHDRDAKGEAVANVE